MAVCRRPKRREAVFDMAKKEKKEKKPKKEKRSGKEKKENKKKRGKRGKRGKEPELEEAEKPKKDDWLYYSEGPLSFLIAVLLILCVLDAVLAAYALIYSKRIERENIAAQNIPVIHENINGTTWFLLKDGTYVHADGTTDGGDEPPPLPGAQNEPAGDETGAEQQEGDSGEETQEGAGEGQNASEPAQTETPANP